MKLTEAQKLQIVDDYDDRAWIECWSCGGEGSHDDCFEDTCVCLDPPCHKVRCSECKGKGGWYEDPCPTLATQPQPEGGPDA